MKVYIYEKKGDRNRYEVVENVVSVNLMLDTYFIHTTDSIITVQCKDYMITVYGY